MCRIKFQETFRINNSVSDFSIKSYSRKTQIKIDNQIFYNFFDHEFTIRSCPAYENVANKMLNQIF